MYSYDNIYSTMERVSATKVQIVVTTKGPNNLQQVLTFPDGSKKERPVRINTCEEGDEVLYALSVRENPVFIGTQRGWYLLINGLLASRHQHIDFPE